MLQTMARYQPMLHTALTMATSSDRDSLVLHGLALNCVAGQFTSLAADTAPRIDSTLGALLLGTFFGMMIYGLSVQQVYKYFVLYPNDIRPIKLIVAAIFVFDAFHTACCIVGCYWHLVTNYFNPSSLAESHWSIQLTAPSYGIVVILCQIFYARRVYLLGRYRWVTVLAVAGMLSLAGFCAAMTTDSFIYANSVELEKKSWMIAGTLGSALATDLVLASTLVIALWRSRSGFEPTNWVIGKIIIFAVNSGLTLSFIATCAFIFTVILPGNLIFLGLSAVGTKIYVASTLATLNSRRTLAARMTSSGTLALGRTPVYRPSAKETWHVPEDHPADEPSMVFASMPSTHNGSLVDSAASLKVAV